MKRRPPDPEQLAPAAFFGGFLLVVAGVALASIVAGLIVAGVLLVGGAVVFELNQHRGESES